MSTETSVKEEGFQIVIKDALYTKELYQTYKIDEDAINHRKQGTKTSEDQIGDNEDVNYNIEEKETTFRCFLVLGNKNRRIVDRRKKVIVLGRKRNVQGVTS